MTRFQKLAQQNVGLMPGSVVQAVEAKVEKIRIRFIDYDENDLREEQVESIEPCLPLKDAPSVSWINIDGLHDPELITKLGDAFGLHRLLLEDVVNTNQRPKAEDFGAHVFVVLKMVRFDPEAQQIRWEQFSLVLGARFVLTFQERYGDVFEGVRERLRKSKGRIRRAGADYLGYALLDAIIDGYFVAIESVAERIEDLETRVTAEADTPRETLHEIYAMKRELIHLRRLALPAREVTNALLRDRSGTFESETEPFLRDLHDHAIRVTDLIDSCRETLSSLQDLHLSIVSNRMNEVMKVLTIFASIFIPLTFIAGIYGMNFDNMPELHSAWGYPLVWATMLATAFGLLVYFRRKRWI